MLKGGVVQDNQMPSPHDGVGKNWRLRGIAGLVMKKELNIQRGGRKVSGGPALFGEYPNIKSGKGKRGKKS